jgi:hypothetical protein
VTITVRRTLDALADPKRYLLELERLYAKVQGHRRAHTLMHDTVPFADLVYAPGALAKLLAREVAADRYELSPARVKRVLLDKPRDIFYFEALDLVVHAVVGQLLTDAVEPSLSPHVYSYRPGMSSWRAVRALAAHVRRYARPLPADRRGLYVIRCDVQSYADSIPLDAGSLLWTLVRSALGMTGQEPAWKLVQRVIRPELVEPDGSRSERTRGVPVGSPVVTPLLNLYLDALDHELAAEDGAFYARFGDDMLFAHPDPVRARKALAAVRSFLCSNRLELHDEKLGILYWNGAGRRSTAWPEAHGTKDVVYLGAQIQFDGTIALPRSKLRDVLLDLRQRLRASHRMLRNADRTTRERALCQIATEAVDVRSVFQAPHADLLHCLVTDRRQLAHLDHLIALAIAETVSGLRGPRAFRDVPWRRLRREHGLVSLVALRNHGKS